MANLTKLLTDSVILAKTGKRANGSVAIGRKGAIAVDREGNPILPKALPACADLLYRTRKIRLEAQREIDLYEKLEGALRERLIAELPKSKSSGISGLLANAAIETRRIPQVQNWDKFYAFVKRTGSFVLLQKRLSEEAVKEMMEDKKVIPGIVMFNVKKVSCTAIKGGK